MVYTEDLRKADESYEVRFNSRGEAIHVYIKDGTAIIFSCLDNFIRYVYNGEQVERYYVNSVDLIGLYVSDKYEFGKLKPIMEKLQLRHNG